MRRTRHKDGLLLLQHGEQGQPGLITQAQVIGSPEPVRRYKEFISGTEGYP